MGNGEMNYLREVFATHTAIEEMNKMNKDIEEMNKMNKDNSERTSAKEKITKKINELPPGPVEDWPLKINEIDATVSFIGTEERKGKKGENYTNKKYEISIEARQDRAGRPKQAAKRNMIITGQVMIGDKIITEGGKVLHYSKQGKTTEQKQKQREKQTNRQTH